MQARITADLSGIAPEAVHDLYSNIKVNENKFLSKFKDYCSKPISIQNSSLKSSIEEFNT